MGRKKEPKCKIYSSKKIVLTEQEKEELEHKLQKEAEKYERDSKCGGIDENGNYTALHYRWMNEM